MHDSLTQGDRPGVCENQIPNNGDDRLLDGCHPLAGRNHFGLNGVGVTRWVNADHWVKTGTGVVKTAFPAARYPYRHPY